MRDRLRTASLLALAALVLLASCSREEKPAAPPAPSPPPAAAPPQAAAPMQLRVDDITLGNSLAADKTVAMATYEFAPTDTIYASVRTSGTSPNATLGATWTYQDGQTVEEQTQQIAPTGPAVTEFHISKPDGWPTGMYKVTVFLDGMEAGSKELVVK
jgi:hypothetical protein